MGTTLGLVEDYDDEYADLPEEPERARGDRTPASAGDGATRVDPSNVRRIAPVRSPDPARDSSRGTSTVRPVPRTKVHVTEPTAFNDVEEVGEQFRNGIPVVMDLSDAKESVAKRLLDFASGLIFGLDGRIERIADRVFLLTPLGVEVPTEERRRLTERDSSSRT